MAVAVCGADCKCSFGMAPTKLVILPKMPIFACMLPIGTIMDFVPMMNIPTFGMCRAPTNPAVIAATAAALGTPTPAPCVPVTTPWIPTKPGVLLGVLPALQSDCTCMCSWAGVISISSPGQNIVV